MIEGFYTYTGKNWIWVERSIRFLSGSGSKGKHLTTTYQRVNLRTIPNAMFIQNERLWAICRGSVYYSALSTRPHFFFYQKVQLQVSLRLSSTNLNRFDSFLPHRSRSTGLSRIPGVALFYSELIIKCGGTAQTELHSPWINATQRKSLNHCYPANKFTLL